MPSVPEFDKRTSGRDPMFGEPYWNSKCGHYRISNMKCTRPWRTFRRMKNKKGFPWIGVGVGSVDRAGAIMAAVKHSQGIPVE